MATVAYAYSHPLLDSSPEPSIWQELEGEVITRVYHDLGDRLQLQQLLEDCAKSDAAIDDSITTVVLQRLDDLGDTVDEVGDRLQRFRAIGVTVRSLDPDTEFPAHAEQNIQHSSTESNPDPSSLLTLFQTLQQRQNSQRLRLGHARNRVKALPPPGKAPYGYRRGKERYAIDRSTAPVVKDFVEHFLLYGSLRGSVRYLAKKHNKTISVSTGQRWLSSPVYRGDLAYRNGDVISDTHSPIISRDEAAQVDRLLRRNRKLPARTASAPRSLAGLVTCGTCQSAMKITRTTSRKKGAKTYLYLTPVTCPYRTAPASAPKTPPQTARPPDASIAAASMPADDLPSVPCRSIGYEQVLSATVETICTELPHAIAKATLPDLDGVKAMIQQQIADKEAILQQLPQLQDEGILDADTADLRAYTLRTEIADLRQHRDQLPPVNLMAIAQTVSIPQFWWDLSEAERRFYFREFIERIEINWVQSQSDSHSSNALELSVQLAFMF